MAKDPAVLFYYQDFLVGTEFMTDDEVGKYIRILCHQADKGSLTKKQVLSICKASAIPNCIQEKLSVDENGLYYNKRMAVEKEKRQKFAESRRNNALKGKAYAQHMENENENISINNNDPVKKEKFIPPTLEEVQSYIKEKGYQVDAEHFIDFYSSKGWMIGKSKMKDWRAALRNSRSWDHNQKFSLTSTATKPTNGKSHSSPLMKDVYGI